jgi:hypothetical protein
MMENKTPADIGQGCGTDYVRIEYLSAPPSSEAGGERSAAGDLACRKNAAYSCVTAPDFHRFRL